jgi:hypothetical protein
VSLGRIDLQRRLEPTRLLSPLRFGFTHLRGDRGQVLLPLREKVSAKPTDEGFLCRLPYDIRNLIGEGVRPLIRPASAGHLLPQGERDEPGTAGYALINHDVFEMCECRSPQAGGASSRGPRTALAPAGSGE